MFHFFRIRNEINSFSTISELSHYQNNITTVRYNNGTSVVMVVDPSTAKSTGFYKPLGMQATVMLMTTTCWWLYDGDSFKMLVAQTSCRWLFIVKNRSSVSQIGHQNLNIVTNINRLHFPLPTSMQPYKF